MRTLKIALPVLISLVAIYLLLRDIELSAVIRYLTPHVFLVFLPACLGYVVCSLLLEAVSLWRPMAANSPTFSVAEALRIRAASYLVVILHMVAGAGALAYLLSRRAGTELAHAAGVIALIMMIDLLIVLLVVATGAMMGAGTSIEQQVGVMAGAIFGIAGGLFALRVHSPFSWIERLRMAELFSAARTIPSSKLAELALLRLFFVASMLLLGWATLLAFDIHVPAAAIMVNFSGVVLASALPSVAGIGPGQLAMVELFQNFASREQLFAAAITFFIGVVGMRALIGIAFAGEYGREALLAVRAAETSKQK